MKRYRVTGTVTISVMVEVEADNEEAAREAALAAPMQQLCHHCSSPDDEVWHTGGELDGVPEILGVSPVQKRSRR